MPLQKTLNKIQKKAATSKRIWRDTVVFLFFVALATAMWLTHALNSARTGIIPVEMVYEGVGEELSFSPQLPRVLHVEVHDEGRRLGTYSKTPLQLHVDLSEQIHGKQGEVRVSADVIRRGINDQLQGTSKLLQVTPEHIQSSYSEQQTEKEFVLPLTVQGVPKGQTVRLFPREVTVSLMVSLRHYNEVRADEIEAVCMYPKGEPEFLEVQIRYKSPYIASARSNPSRVEYIIER